MYCRLGARRSGAWRTKPNMEVKIEKLIYGGEGLAHQDGATVFVPFVLPGEQVTVSPAERKKKFVRAKLDNVREASPERVAALCPHFAICGGCDYQHIPYEAQLKYKAEILRETLRRLGRIDWTGEITTHSSPPWAYRNRAQWKVRPVAERGEELRVSAEGGDTAEASGMLAGKSPRAEAAGRQSLMSELKLRPPKNQGAQNKAPRGGEAARNEESAVSAQDQVAISEESGARGGAALNDECAVSAQGEGGLSEKSAAQKTSLEAGNAAARGSGILAGKSPREEAAVRQSLKSELKLRPPKNRDVRSEAARGGDGALSGESGARNPSHEAGEAAAGASEVFADNPSGILAGKSPQEEAAVRQSLTSELKLRPPKNHRARAGRAAREEDSDGSYGSDSGSMQHFNLQLTEMYDAHVQQSASISSDGEAEIAFGSRQNRLAGKARMQGAIGAPNRKGLSGALKGSADKAGRDGGGTKLATGYFRANSTALCAVETCEIISPLLLKTLRALRDAGLADEFPRTLRELEAVADASDSKLLLTATFAGFPARAAEVAEKMRRLVPEIESLLFFDPTRERMELFGPGFIEYEACGTKFRVGHFSFFQVNRFVVDELARVAVEGDEGGRLALDLFAGVGLFSVGLAKRFERVVAVESNPAAARDLEGNIRGATVEVRGADVESFLRKYKEKPDLALLDPPRAGLGPEGLKSLARVGPKRITYVSCEPPTLARDLAGLIESGYEISEVHLLDLFPQTFHMEAVVRLKRR